MLLPKPLRAPNSYDHLHRNPWFIQDWNGCSTMFGIELSQSVIDGATLIGLVLGEAIVLYFGYGLLEKVLGPTLTDAIRGD
jgi:hypothetical protein